MDEIILETQTKMESSIKSLHSKLTKISVSGAHPSLLSDIKVNAYESLTPIEQLASIKTLDASTLVVTPFDKTLTKKIVASISEANIGLNPINDGDKIRINVPAVTSEKRELFVKDAKVVGETFKISIRNIRHEALKAIKAGEFSENEIKLLEGKIQSLVNDSNHQIDEIINQKIIYLTTI